MVMTLYQVRGSTVEVLPLQNRMLLLYTMQKQLDPTMVGSSFLFIKTKKIWCSN